jgi:hypothetical protein
MRVYVPVAKQLLEVEPVLAAIRAAGADPVGVCLVEEDDYWSLLTELWSMADEFTVVEHDVVIEPDTLDRFNACASGWCAQRYAYFVGPYAGLGCMRFRSRLITRNPDALRRVGTMSDPTHPARHWCRLDAWLQQVLSASGETLCIHEGTLEHLGGTVPSHGCVAGLQTE